MPAPRPKPPGDAAESVTIDVDVTEIDGVTHDAGAPHGDDARRASGAGPRGPAPGQGWRTEWAGRVRTLDSRWWPLWVLLGIVAVLLALTVGLVFAVIYLIFRIILITIRWLVAFIAPGSGGGIVRR